MTRVTDSGDRSSDDSVSIWHRRIPGIRYISSVACLVGGVGLLILFATATDEMWRLVGGLILLVLGIVSIPIVAWMERRRI